MLCHLGTRSFNVLFIVLVGFSVYSQTNLQSNKRELSVNNWLKLAQRYQYDNQDSVKYYSNKILLHSSNQDQKQERAEALRLLSMSYESQGEYKKALAYGKDALSIWREINNEAKVANVLNGIGIIYDQQGMFYEALKFYNEAYEIYKKLDDEQNLAMMDINLGILFKSQGQYTQVIEHYKAAYEIYKKLNLAEEIAFCEANLGSVYYYTKEYDSCIYYSKRAEKSLAEQKNLRFLPVAQANVGLGLLEKNELLEADRYLHEALTAHRSFGNKKETSFVLIHLARLYERQGKIKESIQSLQEAKQLAIEINSPQQNMDASNLLSEYYAKQNLYREAYLEYVNYSTVKDTLFQQTKNKEITNHQVRYETGRKEQEIALLTQKNQINELALKQRSLSLVIAVLLVILLAFVVWNINRTRKLKESQLQKEANMQAKLLRLEAQNELQKDRLRISRDLHDNIGANLTYIHTSVNEMMHQDKNYEDLKSLLSDTITELRRTVWMINKPSISIEEWLIKLREYYNRIDKIEVETRNNHDFILTSKEATSMFRIIQEATNNSLKHGKASHIRLTVETSAKHLLVRVEDDGVGFKINSDSEGFGLMNMQQHAQEINATIQIVSDEGTQVHVKLPNAEYT
jgi:two-component system NarL family sensor kinase